MTGMPNDYSKDIEEMLEWFIARFRSGKVPSPSVWEYVRCTIALYRLVMKDKKRS